jgi:hypothetical protein
MNLLPGDERIRRLEVTAWAVLPPPVSPWTLQAIEVIPIAIDGSRGEG